LLKPDGVDGDYDNDDLQDVCAGEFQYQLMTIISNVDLTSQPNELTFVEEGF
jgi:hypothetical protein